MALKNKLLIPGVIGATAFTGVGSGMIISAISAGAESATTATSGTNTSTASTASSSTATPSGTPSGPHTANGITETPLTGDTLTKATSAAKVAEPGATVERAETDAEGATYEVHMTKSDGSEVTVKLDANFKVTSTESGR